MAFNKLKIKTLRMGDWDVTGGLLIPVLDKPQMRRQLLSATLVLMI